MLANVTNTVGLVPGSLSGAVGYRRELAGQGRRVSRLAVASVLGGITGAVLLLVLPEEAFQAIVPVLIGLACVMVVVQPRVAARLRAREGHQRREHAGPLLYARIYLAGIYGGYFGAAQGVLLIAIMGLLLDEHLQRINAAKNVLALLVNAVAALVFIAVTDIAWEAAALIAVGSTVGGQVGARDRPADPAAGAARTGRRGGPGGDGADPRQLVPLTAAAGAAWPLRRAR